MIKFVKYICGIPIWVRINGDDEISILIHYIRIVDISHIVMELSISMIRVHFARLTISYKKIFFLSGLLNIYPLVTIFPLSSKYIP